MRGSNRSLGVLLALALVGGAILGAPSSNASGAPDELPNLIPLPREIVLGRADTGTGTAAIRLDTVVANRGDGHLDLQGMPDQGSTEVATAYQCIDWDVERACLERTEVGEFVWHPEHGHHHFDGFAKYELRALNRRDRPVLGRGGVVAGGKKVSFCLIDYEEDRDSPTFMSGTGATGWPGYSTCLVGSGSQGISRGWRDVYTSGLTGQQIVVDDVAPGRYALVITIDPEDRLLETDETDNTLAIRLSLGPEGLIEECVFAPDMKSCAPR